MWDVIVLIPDRCLSVTFPEYFSVSVYGLYQGLPGAGPFWTLRPSFEQIW